VWIRFIFIYYVAFLYLLELTKRSICVLGCPCFGDYVFNVLDSSSIESVYGVTRKGVAENNKENQSMTSNITLKEAVQAYMQSLEQAGKSPRTLYTYGKDFEQIQRFFGEEKKLSAILKLQVGKFMKSDELLTLPNGNPRAQQTVKKTYRVMRAFFYWAQSEGLIEEVPMPKTGLTFEPVGEDEAIA
jgi:hypothetical protein